MDNIDRKLYLCKPNRKKYCCINGVIPETVVLVQNQKDYDVLEFDVTKYVQDANANDVLSEGYDYLHTYMEVYLDGYGCFQMQEPEIINDGTKEYKRVVAYSTEKEFENTRLTGIKINKGTSDSLEYLVDGNIDDLGFAKEYISFYNPTNTKLSLLHIILNYMPTWSVTDESIDSTLWDKKISVECDGDNLYGFLTNTIAPKLKCVFTFDTVKKVVYATHVDNLGEDTEVYISYRNLLNSINIICEEDSVFTKLEILGSDELDIRNVNFNDKYIINIDWFKKEPYMSEELITKYENWVKYREANRDLFRSKSIELAKLDKEIAEFENRMPNSADAYAQWDTMDLEDLNVNLAYYNAQLTALRVSVDDSPQYNADGNYIPWVDAYGEIDDRKYMDLLFYNVNVESFLLYYECIYYIIPNITIAIVNSGKDEADRAEYKTGYETDWMLYGINELKAHKELYEEEILNNNLDKYAAEWSSLTDAQQAVHNYNETNYNIYHNKYLYYYDLLYATSGTTGVMNNLNVRTADKETVESVRATVIEERNKLIQESSLIAGNFGLTEDDINTLNTLFHSTTYSNDNIITTDIDNTITTIDVQEELFQDGLFKSYEYSQPQFEFSVDVDDLNQIEEFSKWYGCDKIGNFIHVDYTDTFSTKVRIISKTLYPCIAGGKTTLEFSNMINSRSGRSDLTSLINETGSGTSSSSSSSSSSKSSSDGFSLEYLTNLTKALSRTTYFNSVVSNNYNDNTIDSGLINNLIENYFNTAKIGGWRKNATSLYIDGTLADGETCHVCISNNLYDKNQGNPYNPVFYVIYNGNYQWYVRSNGDMICAGLTSLGVATMNELVVGNNTKNSPVTIRNNSMGESSIAYENKYRTWVQGAGVGGGNDTFGLWSGLAIVETTDYQGNKNINGSLFNNYNTTSTIGNSASPWSAGYYGTLYTSSGTVSVSDENYKKEFTQFDDRYYKLASMIDLQLFKYKDGTSDRFHSGAVAQQIISCMKECNITLDEYGLICLLELEDEDGNECSQYRLRYDELNILMNWYNRKRIQEQQSEIDKLKSTVAELTTLVKSLLPKEEVVEEEVTTEETTEVTTEEVVEETETSEEAATE